MTLTFLGRDVISHVTIRFTVHVGHFLLVVLWSKSLSLTVSEIFCLKPHVLIDTMLNRHCARAISRDMYIYVKFNYIFQFLTSTLPFHYVTLVSNGVFSVWTSDVKGEIWRKFS